MKWWHEIFITGLLNFSNFFEFSFQLFSTCLGVCFSFWKSDWKSSRWIPCHLYPCLLHSEIQLHPHRITCKSDSAVVFVDFLLSLRIVFFWMFIKPMMKFLSKFFEALRFSTYSVSYRSRVVSTWYEELLHWFSFCSGLEPVYSQWRFSRCHLWLTTTLNYLLYLLQYCVNTIRVGPNEHVFFVFLVNSCELVWIHSRIWTDPSSHEFTRPKYGPLNSCELMWTHFFRFFGCIRHICGKKNKKTNNFLVNSYELCARRQEQNRFSLHMNSYEFMWTRCPVWNDPEEVKKLLHRLDVWCVIRERWMELS